MLINYKEQTGLIIDILVPRDENIQDKKREKIDKKYQSLKKIELEQLWKVKIMQCYFCKSSWEGSLGHMIMKPIDHINV